MSPRQVCKDLRIKTRKFTLDFSKKTYVMGVLNVTPDSFSDGGLFFNTDKAIERGLSMVREGADIIDIGGESTRPGAGEVGVQEEMSRVIPVIGGILKNVKIPISVDTRKSKIAEAAIRAGAAIVNDISGLTFDRGMADVIYRYGVAAILMHSKGTPQTMQVNPTYRNLIKEISASFRCSLKSASRAGISQEKLIIDPGIGFGKTAEHNLEILARLDEFMALGSPICIGTSRKSFIGKVLNIPRADERLAGTLATSVIAITKGANIVRVHDVKEIAEAVKITDKILRK